MRDDAGCCGELNCVFVMKKLWLNMDGDAATGKAEDALGGEGWTLPNCVLVNSDSLAATAVGQAG